MYGDAGQHADLGAGPVSTNSGQVAGLVPDYSVLLHPWVMRAEVRIAYPSAGRITALLINKLFGDDVDLFAAKMRVALKMLVGRLAHECDMLTRVFVQGHHLETAVAR